MPENLRVAIVKLSGSRSSGSYYWSDEDYMKTQQSYLDMFTETFQKSKRVVKVSSIPDLLISSNPTFTSIRESAVRTQADIVAIYSISGDVYSKYRWFAKNDIKAFATAQLIILDVRTGLIPFSAIITKDVLSQKKDSDLNETETRNRIKNEAVLLTIEEIGKQLAAFLGK